MEKENNEVDVKKELEQTKKTEVKEDNKEEVKEDKGISTLEEAKKVADEIRKQNEIMSDNLKKAERLTTENILSGRAPKGKEVTYEDRVTQKAREILKGTGYDKELFGEK